MAFRFHPDTLYSLDELRKRLAGTVELPTLLDRLGLRDRRCFRGALWGWEIIEASHKAEPFSRAGKGAGAAVVDVHPGASRGRKAMSADPVRKLGAGDLDP